MANATVEPAEWPATTMQLGIEQPGEGRIEGGDVVQVVDQEVRGLGSVDELGDKWEHSSGARMPLASQSATHGVRVGER